MRKLLLILSLLSVTAHAAPAQDLPQLRDDVPVFTDSGVVVFAYQRIGEDTMPEASLRTEQFGAQIEELSSGTYNIVALPRALEQLKAGEKLPARSVALTFDGGYRSALDNALPQLISAKIPFTVFIAPDIIDQNLPQHMSWADIKSLARYDFISFGIHPAGYARLSTAGREEALRAINSAKGKFHDNIGRDVPFFAYPYGETDGAYMKLIGQQGFTAAFGLHSGVVHSASDFLFLPRFTMTEVYGGLDRFRLTANALPLPVFDFEPRDLRGAENPPHIGFTLHPALAKDAVHLSCFASEQGRLEQEILGTGRIELKIHEPFTEDRIRINCTLPVSNAALPEDGIPGVWRWFGMMLTLPDTADTGLLSQQADGVD